MTPPVILGRGSGDGDRLTAFQSKYCRMCALEIRQGVLIFGNEGQRLQLPEKIRKTVSILVLEEDSLPKKICTECCSSLEDYSKYKDTVLDAQEKLTSIVRNIERCLEASASGILSSGHSSSRKRNVEVQKESKSKVVPGPVPVQAESQDEPILLSPDDDNSPAIIYSVDEGDDDDVKSPMSIQSAEDSPVVIRTPVAEEDKNVTNVQTQEDCNVSESKPSTSVNFGSPSSKNKSKIEGEVLGGSPKKSTGCESQVQVTKGGECGKSFQLIIPSPSKNNNPSTSSAIPVALVVPKDKQDDGKESGLDIKCGLCGFVPQDKKDIEAHHTADHDLLKYPSPVYGCPECPRITENFNAMRIHLYRHKQDDRFKCKECDKSYAFENQLKCHVLAAHNPNGKAFSCKICGKRFSAKCSLVAHMTSKHPVSSEEKVLVDKPGESKRIENAETESSNIITKSEESSSSKGLRCIALERDSKYSVLDNDMDTSFVSDDISDSEQPEPLEKTHQESQECETKADCTSVSDTPNNARSDSSSSKTSGISIVHPSDCSTKLEGKSEKEEGIWKCEYCDKILQSETGYRIHIKKHRGKRFHCELCQAIFTQAGSLKHHVLTKHPGVLPNEKETFSCSSCDKVFATKKRLRDHQRLHKQPETALLCPICKKSYKSAEHLRFHMRYHQGNEHQCSSCEKSFRNIKQLQCHENTHTGNKPFKCSKCSAEFGNSGSHYKHMKKCIGISNVQEETKPVCSKNTDKDKDLKEVPKTPRPTAPSHTQSQQPCETVTNSNNTFGSCHSDPAGSSHLSTETVTVNIQETNSSAGPNSNLIPSISNAPVTSQSLLSSEHNQPSEYINHSNAIDSTHVSQSHPNSSTSVPVPAPATNYSHQQYQVSHHQHQHNQSSSSINHYQQTPWQTTSSANLNQGQMSGSTSKPFLPSQQQQPQPPHSHTGSLGSMDLVDCEIHHSLGSENLSAHNLSYQHHHTHIYPSNHHSSSSNQHVVTSHGQQNISPHNANSSNSSLPVSTTHSSNPAISSTNSSLIITSSHATHQSHTNNSTNSRCHQSEPMELSYKLQLENNEFQDMPMELTKVFQRDPLELCVRQDFNPLMDLSSRVQDAHGMHMNSMSMNNGMSSNSGNGNCGNSSLVGISMYHNKLDLVDRDMSFNDLSGAFRQPIDLIARPEDSHNLCSEGNLVDLSLRSAAFGQDQSASTFLRELIDLSARSDSFHGELNLTNKQHHQQQQHSHGNTHQNHHNLHHHGSGNHHNNNNNTTTTAPMNKSSSGGNGNGQSHHVNGTSSFQNLYHDSIFSMQNQ